MFTSNFSRKLGRRFSQAGQLLFSPEFISYESMFAAVRARYSTSEEVRHYSQLVTEGLRADEVQALNEAGVHERAVGGRRALVVGCGAGREVFALEREGFEVDGCDVAADMVRAAEGARESGASRVRFHHGPWPAGEPRFELVFVTSSLTNHIPGRTGRVRFFAECAKRLAPGGKIVFYPDIFDLREARRFLVASLILRARALVGAAEWEPGDTVRANLGKHAPAASLVFYHYYASQAEVASELKAAGLEGSQLSSDFWVACPGEG